jgi:zinc protease
MNGFELGRELAGDALEADGCRNGPTEYPGFACPQSHPAAPPGGRALRGCPDVAAGLQPAGSAEMPAENGGTDGALATGRRDDVGNQDQRQGQRQLAGGIKSRRYVGQRQLAGGMGMPKGDSPRSGDSPQRASGEMARATPPPRGRGLLVLGLAMIWPLVAQPTHALDPAPLPARPEAIEFAPLAFEPPAAADHRHVLPDGTVVFLAPSHEFPLINLAITFKGGSSLDPADLPGLAAFTARLVREGGTAARPPAAFDEELDFLASDVKVAASETFTTATLNCLASTFPESLALFLEMLRTPGFDVGRLETARARQLAQLAQRNDDASKILAREWKRLAFGGDHFEAAEPTAAQVEAVSRERLSAMHKQIFHPGNAIIAVAGDFEPAAMLAALEKALAGWERGSAAPAPVAPTATLAPGLYHVPKAIPQGKVVIGRRSIERDDPDAIPLVLLNEILGAGGFTSRLMQQVRSNEGLAYSVRSVLQPRVEYPGDFRAGFESKNTTVALATKIVLDEIRRIREEPVPEEEIETARRGLIETFPRRFESKPQMLQVFVNDEFTSRPADFWKTYREKLEAVTAADLQRVARKHLDPESLAILVVGDWEAIAPGDLDKRASMQDFFGGKVTHLPLRDPLTLEPLP